MDLGSVGKIDAILHDELAPGTRARRTDDIG
jgi:hypothetical protein